MLLPKTMPQLPLWYRRVPEILGRLKTPGMPPVLDRPAIEALFAVRRRQAIRLLGAAQGYQIGKTFVVERQALIDFLASHREIWRGAGSSRPQAAHRRGAQRGR